MRAPSKEMRFFFHLKLGNGPSSTSVWVMSEPLIWKASRRICLCRCTIEELKSER